MKNVKSFTMRSVLFALFTLFSATMFAQITVSGTIYDDMGEPTGGAAIREKGTNNGVASDANGKYTLKVSGANAVLQVSFMGFQTQEIRVNGRTKIDFNLQSDTRTLDEVIAIGYGVQHKSDLTGAVASVRADDLKNRSTTDAAAALQGKAAGVQILNSSGKPGQGASIRVRGYSSNSDNIGPLLIVDGLQVDNIQYLDPELIESMEVLKDAASAAIYGAEAGNGVVLITTKQGAKKGQGTITYNAKFSLQSLGNVPKLLNASQFKDWMTMSLGADRVNGDLADAQKTYGWDPNTDTNWLDEYFENTWAQQHSLTFQGGNERGRYFLNVNHVNQDGIVKGNKDKYERLTAQINADYKIKDWLQVGTNNSIEKWSTRGVSEQGYGTSFEMLLLIDPLTPLYWTNPNQMLGEYRQYYDAIQAGNSNYTLFGDENGYYATSYFNTRLAGGNPFSQRDRSYGKNSGATVRGTTFMNITPIKQVTFTSRLGYRLAFSNSSNWEFPYYLNGQSKGDNYRIEGASNNNTWYQWENFVNYSDVFAGKHAVGAMAGMSYRQRDTNGVSANASGPDILTSYEPNYIYLNCVNGNESTVKNFSGMPGTSRAMSYFGRLTYSYDNRYALQANFRADAFDSSKLPKDNRWGKFFSASAGWTFSNEEFFKNAVDPSIMSFGKIRASWGQNGNVNVLNNYAYTAGIATNSQWYQYGVTNAGSYGSMPNGIANPNLTWETSEQLDLGLDMRFLNDRLAVGIDWYKKTTKDLLVKAPAMPESGVSEMTINAGEIRNSGLEIELSWKDRIGDFRYSVTGNIATLSNKVTYIDRSIPRIPGATVEGSSPETVRCYFEKGEPLWYMRGYKYLRTAEDGTAIYQKIIRDEDGNITGYKETNDPQADDMQNIGSGIPNLTYGITLNAEYKGFDLSIFGAGAAGNDVYYGLYRTGYNNIAKGIYDDFKSGKLPNAQSVAGSGQFWRSSAMVYDGSFFKIKQIQLGYTLPKTITRKAYIENLRCYVSLDDFFTFTKYPGLDPETCTAEYNCPGLDKGAYPNMKKVVLGINVTF